MRLGSSHAAFHLAASSRYGPPSSSPSALTQLGRSFTCFLPLARIKIYVFAFTLHVIHVPQWKLNQKINMIYGVPTDGAHGVHCPPMGAESVCRSASKDRSVGQLAGADLSCMFSGVRINSGPRFQLVSIFRFDLSLCLLLLALLCDLPGGGSILNVPQSTSVGLPGGGAILNVPRPCPSGGTRISMCTC